MLVFQTLCERQLLVHGWGNLQGNIKNVGGGGFQKKERDTSSHHHKRLNGKHENRLVCGVGGRTWGSPYLMTSRSSGERGRQWQEK